MNNHQEGELRIYEVTNRDTGEKRFIADYNASDACKQAGWLIGDCYVNEQKPRRKLIPDHEPTFYVKLPCRTCPYQYAECTKLPDDECPGRPQCPDLNEWLKQIANAHLCAYVGEPLTKTDYQLGQKWVTLQEAIKELYPNPPPTPPNPLERACIPMIAMV